MTREVIASASGDDRSASAAGAPNRKPRRIRNCQNFPQLSAIFSGKTPRATTRARQRESRSDGRRGGRIRDGGGARPVVPEDDAFSRRSDAYLARALRLMLHPGRCKRGGGRNPGGYGEGV